jgi:hypothetical protein
MGGRLRIQECLAYQKGLEGKDAEDSSRSNASRQILRHAA